MRRSSSSQPAVSTAAAAYHVPQTRGPPAGRGQAPEGNGAVGPAEVTRHLIEDHDRIAQSMNDVVVRRIFAAGLDLEAALSLIGDHKGASKICHAIDELDHAIRDIRDIIFDHGHAIRGHARGAR
jgi:hypothetical protein